MNGMKNSFQEAEEAAQAKENRRIGRAAAAEAKAHAAAEAVARAEAEADADAAGSVAKSPSGTQISHVVLNRKLDVKFLIHLFGLQPSLVRVMSCSWVRRKVTRIITEKK